MAVSTLPSLSFSPTSWHSLWAPAPQSQGWGLDVWIMSSCCPLMTPVRCKYSLPASGLCIWGSQRPSGRVGLAQGERGRAGYNLAPWLQPAILLAATRKERSDRHLIWNTCCMPSLVALHCNARWYYAQFKGRYWDGRLGLNI